MNLLTKAEKLRQEQSRARERLIALNKKDEPSDEERAELNTLTDRLEAIEPEIRSATTADAAERAAAEAATEAEQRAAPDAEQRELQKLQGRVRIASYLGAAAEMRGIDGAELEFNAAHKLPPGHFPLRLLAPEDAELRTMTDTDIQVTPRRWIDRLFHGTGAEYMGLTFDAVGSGSASYPATTSGGTPAQRGREEAAVAGAWTIGVTNFDPTRLSLHYEFNIEDAARLSGLEEALRRDMRAAMTERMDYIIFNGDAGANEATADIAGFFTSGAAETTLTQANKVKADQVLQALLAFVDGQHAESLGDLRIVSSVGSNVLWEGTIHAAAVENQTIAQFLRAAGVSWRTRGGIDVNTANGDFGAAIGLARGITGAGVVPVWESASMIRDPYSSASSGKILITLHTLWNWGLVRSDNFKRIKYVA